MLLLAGASAGLHAQLSSVDSGASGANMVQWDEALLQEWSSTQPWLRIRARPDPTNPENAEAVAAEVAGLARLRELGFKPIPFYRWSNTSWASGVRSPHGRHVPLDLREAYQRGFAYGKTYGAVVAGFEIENEPDISFVEENAETYMAYQKAVYLGLKRGSEGVRETGEERRKLPATSVRPMRPADRGISAGRRASLSRFPLSGLHYPASSPQTPLVVMAPLALPPGPYFEQLVANGLFSYTDAFNYHYYGYAEDFTGVYRQFESAVRENVGQDRRIPLRSEKAGFGNPALQKKQLPVLLTEYGYGSLDGTTRDTVDGRVRQWRWFKSVGEQIHDLRIAGPMAFYLSPYLGPAKNEFGLAVRPANVGRDLPNPPNQKTQEDRSQPQFTAGTLTFTPEDFGVTKAEPWIRHIGRKFGNNEATPALAWLWEAGKRRYAPRDWKITAAPASPVVIDFVAGDDLRQVKRYGGYLAVGRDRRIPPRSEKAGSGDPALQSGTIVLYNFSDTTMSGIIEAVAGRDLLKNVEELEREQELEPMCRVEIPVHLSVPASEFAKHRLALRFVPQRNAESSQAGFGAAVFSTAFYADPTDMIETVLFDFTNAGQEDSTHSEKAGYGDPPLRQSSSPLSAFRYASEEPRLNPQSNSLWRTTPGVTVTESSDGTWNFAIDRLPDEPLRPAMAELVLPPDFVFPDGGMMRFAYRLSMLGGELPKEGAYFEPYFRTANGNLYQVWPRQQAGLWWQSYAEVKENYTMAFYGRANLPWRFADNRIVSLVFFFRPSALPAVFEIKQPRIVKLGIKSRKY